MTKPTSRLLATGVLVCLGVAPLARAADRDVTHDETDEILGRLEWFYGDRGMWDPIGADPLAGTFGKLRAEAALKTIALTEAQQRAHRAPAIWTNIGPAPIDRTGLAGDATGRITGFAIDPTNPNIIYLGASAGGVWKTTNGGTSWTPIFDQQPTQATGSIAVAPTNSNEVWVGTGDYNGDAYYPFYGMGAYRSTDAGATWQARNGSGPTAMLLTRITSVILHPTNPSIVVIGGNSTSVGGGASPGGIFYSADAGLTWSQAYSGDVLEVVRDSGNAAVLYAGAKNVGCLKSTDGGQTWVSSSTGLNVAGNKVEIAISPSNPQTIYCMSENTDLYRTTDGAATWTLANGNACGGQCFYNMTMKVALNDPNTLYIGTLVPTKSTNGGTTITPLSGYGQKLHPDVQHIDRHPTDPNTIYVGTDGGLWKTPDAGTTFVNLNGNLSITQFYDCGVHPTLDTIALAGAQDNGHAKYAGIPAWLPTAPTGDGMSAVISPIDPLLWYVTTYPNGAGRPQIFRSTNGGNGYTAIAGPITEPGDWFTPLALDPVDGDTLYAGAKSVWRSTDRGATWTLLPGSTFNTVVRSLAVAPSDQNTIYAGANNDLRRSTDYGATWASALGNLPARTYNSLNVDPQDPMHVYVTIPTYTTNPMWYSVNGGGTWTGAANGLPQVAANDVLLLKNPTRVYVADDVGVYVAPSDAGPFTPDMNGMPQGVPVSDLEFNSTTNTIDAATYGRGVFQKDAGGVFLADVTVGKGAGSPAANDTRLNAYRVDGTQITQIDFDAFSGVGSGFGVNSAGGDVTGDGLAEVLAGQGPGQTNPPVGKGFDRAGLPIGGINFAAYGGSGYGLNVAYGDLDADDIDEILTGPGEGPTYGPQVRAWNYDNSGTTTAIAKINYYAYGTLKYGVNVVGVNYDADAIYKEILTGAGPGDVFGPHVRGWNYDGTAITATAKVSFFAFSTLKYGVNVAGGDVERDGFEELLPGAGPGPVFGAQVRGFNFDGGTVSAISKINFVAFATGRYGVNVSSGDLDGDGYAEIATGQGPDATVGAVLKGWNYDAANIVEITAMNKTAFAGVNYGLTVAVGTYGY